MEGEMSAHTTRPDGASAVAALSEAGCTGLADSRKHLRKLGILIGPEAAPAWVPMQATTGL